MANDLGSRDDRRVKRLCHVKIDQGKQDWSIGDEVFKSNAIDEWAAFSNRQFQNAQR